MSAQGLNKRLSPGAAPWAVLLLLALAVCQPLRAGAPGFQRESLGIQTVDGRLRRFSVELALSQAQRERGLMFRRELAPDEGMLFDYGREREVTMWMANTYLALDMLFIRADGRIRRIEADTVPLSRTLIGSGGPVRAVLELPAGTADRLGIQPGDRVLHPRFEPDGAGR